MRKHRPLGMPRSRKTSTLILLLFMVLLGWVLLPPPLSRCENIADEIFGEKVDVGNPVPAVVIEEDQIGIGNSSTFIYRLVAGHSYHIYLSGEWEDATDHATDYDIYVYRIEGIKALFYSSHTESAGILEQVANDVEEQYFVPVETGLYYFVVGNDAIESSGAEPATLMVLEHIEPDNWTSKTMRGKVDEKPVPETTWSYEFVTSADRIRVYVEVPDTLDMYEVRLYVMANPAKGKGQIINGIPVAWEPGLRAEVSGDYGGFNLDPKGFRHKDAMASCEKSGDDMVIDFETPTGDDLLYHLAFIAEYGRGRLDFVVQTDFDPPTLELIDPPETVEAYEPVPVSVEVTDGLPLASITCRYTKDGGDIWRAVTLEKESEGIYVGLIPGVSPGVEVEYAFEAEDELGNTDDVSGGYKAMGASSLSLQVDEQRVQGGEDVVVRGVLQPREREVTVTYAREGAEYNFSVQTDSVGAYNHSLTTDATGEWAVCAEYEGDDDYPPVSSEILNFTVYPLETRLTCNLSSERVEFGKSVTVAGAFSLEKGGLLVELMAKRPETMETFWATTTPSGTYEARFEPTVKGEWTITARVEGDGLSYRGASSLKQELVAVNPSLTTTILRLPTTIIRAARGYLKPPLLYGVVGIAGIVSGGVVFYLRRRE
ncbi:MAG: hypothetical protein JSV27_12120 [Candidatus Bathyarchaeota archaeon]|nr:MAG: hypothetical protein JSV27_12120 [Candidatus Bathyarchaeota archaeon]